MPDDRRPIIRRDGDHVLDVVRPGARLAIPTHIDEDTHRIPTIQRPDWRDLLADDVLAPDGGLRDLARSALERAASIGTEKLSPKVTALLDDLQKVALAFLASMPPR